MRSVADPNLRPRQERKTSALAGRRVLDVSYWDLRGHDGPRSWDFGDWHWAVMGVELTTDQGPVTVTWTDTFHEYGVEVFPEPISRRLNRDENGIEGWSVRDHPLWLARSGCPIRAASTFWETIHIGPGRDGDGVIVSEPETFDVPIALRLDFDAGPVWMVAAAPTWPDLDKVFVPSDEIMVIFSAERMRRIGFPETGFIGGVPTG